jgi:hypothetical protein
MRVSKIRGKTRLLPIGSRRIATSFDVVVRESRRAHKKAAQSVRPIARRPQPRPL